ncbi:MAG: response regulator transcription factor [Taibaiella sp.]|jgi:DNA-binding NarL/FixJ family response regulator
MSIKLAIVDDHVLIVQGLKHLLQQHNDIIIADIYTSGQTLLEGLPQHQPDVLLMDIQLPDKSGNELVRILNKQYPNIKIIALTSMDTIFHIKDMMQHGCLGYVTKQAGPDVLIEAIRKVYKGEEFLEDGIKERWIQSMIKTDKENAKTTPLSRREKEILKLIASEHTNQEIADKLFLSQRTVESHRYSLLQKLNVKNTAGLVRMAVQMGLIEYE